MCLALGVKRDLNASPFLHLSFLSVRFPFFRRPCELRKGRNRVAIICISKHLDGRARGCGVEMKGGERQGCCLGCRGRIGLARGGSPLPAAAAPHPPPPAAPAPPGNGNHSFRVSGPPASANTLPLCHLLSGHKGPSSSAAGRGGNNGRRHTGCTLSAVVTRQRSPRPGRKCTKA